MAHISNISHYSVIATIVIFFQARIELELNRFRERLKMPLIHHLQFPEIASHNYPNSRRFPLPSWAAQVRKSCIFLREELICNCFPRLGIISLQRYPHATSFTLEVPAYLCHCVRLACQMCRCFCQKIIDFELFRARRHDSVALRLPTPSHVLVLLEPFKPPIPIPLGIGTGRHTSAVS